MDNDKRKLTEKELKRKDGFEKISSERKSNYLLSELLICAIRTITEHISLSRQMYYPRYIQRRKILSLYLL